MRFCLFILKKTKVGIALKLRQFVVEKEEKAYGHWGFRLVIILAINSWLLTMDLCLKFLNSPMKR